MRVEFDRGVPKGCIEWLWANVGPGNIRSEPVPWHRQLRKETDAWFYEHERVYPQPHDAFDPRDLRPKYVTIITVKDPKLATLFVLRWA